MTQNKSARIEAMREIVGHYRDRPGKRAHDALRQADSRIDTAEAERSLAMGDNWGAAKAHLHALVHWPQGRTARAIAADLLAACKDSVAGQAG